MPCSSSQYPPSPYDEPELSDYQVVLKRMLSLQQEIDVLEYRANALPKMKARLKKLEEIAKTMGNGG